MVEKAQLRWQLQHHGDEGFHIVVLGYNCECLSVTFLLSCWCVSVGVEFFENFSFRFFFFKTIFRFKKGEKISLAGVKIIW